jgi:hypothetical protein
VRNLLRITFAWAALVAWLVASGVSADVLQVVAYADHVAKSVEVSERDHCGACQAADAARDASDHAAPAKHEVAKAKVKPDGAVWSVRLPVGAPACSVFFREVDVPGSCPELICEVPVPPPEATV